MGRTDTLTVMFTDIVGFTAKTAGMSRESHEALLVGHDRLFLPIIANYSGTRVKSLGDSMLVAFRSPTDAVKCGMALQDAVAAYSRTSGSEKSFQIRVAVSIGEVRVTRGDMFGEAVNVAGRLEEVTPAGEVYFTEGVHLAMNRAEVPAERVEAVRFKGVLEEVGVYRATPQAAGDGEDGAVFPFGGMHRMSSGSGNPVARVLQRAVVDGVYTGGRLRQRLVDFVATAVRVRVVRYAALGMVLLVACGVLLLVRSCARRSAPVLADAEPHIARGNWNTVEAIAEDALEADPRNPEALLLKGHVAAQRASWRPAMSAYRRALEIDDRFQTEGRTVANVVAALDELDEPARELIELYPSGAMIGALRARALRPGYHGRARALAVLARLGEDGGLDRGMIAIHDAAEAPGTEQRVEAVRVLGELRDRRAVPVLREITSATGVKRLLTKGLIAEAEEALRKIEGTPPDAD